MISGLVSVVIPAKDAERWLARAIASARSQAGVDLEIIVVDDGSTDRTAKIAGDADRLVVLPVNQGKSRACNVGLAVARGEFVCIHDADDEMLPGKLAAQLALLSEQPMAGGALVHQVIQIQPGAIPPAWLSGNPALARGPSPYAGSALLRTGAVILAGGLDPAMQISEDIDLFRRLGAVGRAVATCPEPLLRRWIHTANVTKDVRNEDALMVAARAAAHNHRRERQAVEAVVPKPSADWSAAVSRNLAVLESRGAIIAFPHPQQDCAIAELGIEPELDAVHTGDDGQPPIAIRRLALARVGLWYDVAEPECCAEWWRAAEAAELAISTPTGSAGWRARRDSNRRRSDP